jgi:predicted nucleotidyltransferase
MVTVQDTLAHLRHLEAAKRALGRQRAERLRSRLSEAAQSLRARGARRVILFGSLGETEPGPEPDVDIAVDGLPPVEYFPALAELMTLFRARVDLVRLEEAPTSLRERIAQEGRPL